MSNVVQKGKAITLPEDFEDFTPSPDDIENARGLAREIDPLLLACFDAQTYNDDQKDIE